MITNKEARRDAKEFARAQMFYGEGAGNRRKLIQATVDAKTRKNPAYGRVFHQELARQDMAEHATKARWERERKDATAVVGKNLRGLATGNYNSVNTSLLAFIAGIYFARKTGIDRKIYNTVKNRYNLFKERRKLKKNFPHIRPVK